MGRKKKKQVRFVKKSDKYNLKHWFEVKSCPRCGELGKIVQRQKIDSTTRQLMMNKDGTPVMEDVVVGPLIKRNIKIGEDNNGKSILEFHLICIHKCGLDEVMN